MVQAKKKMQLKKLESSMKLVECKQQKLQNLNKQSNVSTVPTFIEYFSNFIFNNIGQNLNKKINGHRFPDDIVDFAYLIKYGNDSYGQIRSFLPFPCVQTLKNRKEQ